MWALYVYQGSFPLLLLFYRCAIFVTSIVLALIMLTGFLFSFQVSFAFLLLRGESGRFFPECVGAVEERRTL
jgi:hypothetical protein